MDTTAIGNLFDKIQAAVNTVNDLEQPLTAGEFEKQISLDSGGKTLSLFDTPVTIDATLNAAVRICKPGEVPDSPFAGAVLTVPANTQYTTLTIGGQISAAANVNATPGVLAVSASGSARTSFAYSHFRPALATESRLAAFTELATSTQLPQLADLTSLTPGETLDYSSILNVDFGLKAKYGSTADVNGVIQLLENIGGSSMALPYTAHIGFSASAAFGFSLYESMRITTGRAATTTPDWVRIRFDREHKSSISFGISVDLSIAYDATAGAQALLDKAFALVPKPEALVTLKQIAALPANWDEFTTQISDQAALIVGRLVDETDWKDAVAASPAVAALVQTANDIVNAYDGLDAKVTSIVEDVLARLDAAGLDKVRPIIAKIAAIDPATFQITSLLSPEAQQVVQWLEVLTGQDIEELAVTSDLRKVLTQAVDAAQKLQKFLTGAESEVLGRIRDVLAKSGATGLVTWLKTNATSVAALQAAGDKAVGDFVQRLVGKQLDKISPADVQKIQAFSARLEQILNAPAALEAKLEKGIQKLKGTIGFSLSSEISRVSEWSAIVDVEIDPGNAAAVKAAKGLQNGHVNQFLSELNQIQVNAGEPRPYLIHEILLTSRHVRTSVAATMLSIAGFNLSEQETAIDESTITVRDGDDGSPVREALYFGGAAVQRISGTTTSEGAAWIRMSATGTGTDVTAAYTEVNPVIRLVYSREDTNTDQESRQSMLEILADLSFATALAGVPTTLVGQQTRFSLEIELGRDAVEALKKDDDEASWNGDVLKAAHRWFFDVDRVNSMEQDSGHQMAVVLLDPQFQQLWADYPSDRFFEADSNSDFGIRLTPTPVDASKNFQPQYRALQMLLALRANAFDKFSAFSVTGAVSLDPKVLAKTARQAADLFRNGQTKWQPPMFNFWYVLARLLRLDRQVFQNGRMVATVRTRQSSTDDWSAPAIFVRTNGINPSNLRLS
ncbi:MAG TPA: hypothetical protein VFV49_09750 [Thermoanaerobaculia bacterium]|nr:hypothetical protein [Thermoanaerobaculia bacterium]